MSCRYLAFDEAKKIATPSPLQSLSVARSRILHSRTVMVRRRANRWLAAAGAPGNDECQHVDHSQQPISRRLLNRQDEQMEWPQCSRREGMPIVKEKSRAYGEIRSGNGAIGQKNSQHLIQPA